MISAVPGGRSLPISPCSPSRTVQATSIRSRVAGEVGRADQLAARRGSARPARPARRAPPSVSAAELDQQRGRLGRQLHPLLRARPRCSGAATISAGATISSTAVAPAATNSGHRLGRRLDPVEVQPGDRRVRAAAGTVSNTASATKASVPSEPTSSRRKISSGVVGVEERAEPVAGRVLDLELAPDPLGAARRRRASRRGSPPAPRPARARPRRSASSAPGAPVSIVGPRRQHEGQLAHRASRSRRVTPQRMPPELLAITPPTRGDVGAGRVGAELAPVRRQHPVGVAEHGARPAPGRGRRRPRR